MESARALGRNSTYVVTLPERLDGEALAAAVEAVRAEPGVLSVEPVRRMYPSVVPNDPYYSDQWNLRSVGASNYGANAAAAWDITTGSADVVIAVIDTGFTDHADLAGRTLPGYDFISDVDTANDGDGRDTDARDPGDWISSADASPGGAFTGCRVQRSSWHGTHVTGIIGATGNNGTGIAGVNWGSSIVPIRALGKCGGDNDDVIDAMRWAAGIDVPGVPHNAHPARVINISLGGDSGSCSVAMQQAVSDVVAAGAVVVTAAGNDSDLASNNEPGNCVGVINVAATGRYGEMAPYSNFGSAVTLAAPGGGDFDWGIRSTVDVGYTTPLADTYKNLEGTSMAAPHVAGAVSLILSIAPTLTPAQVRSVLVSTAHPFPPSGVFSTCAALCGAGVLDVQAALISAGNLRPPGEPTALVAASGPGRAVLTWVAPADDGGTDVVDYRLQRSTNGGLTWTTINDSASDAATSTVTGLKNGTTYTFRVAAVNRVTRGAWSTTAAATPATTPGRTRSLRARRGDQRVSLSWTRPTTTGGAAVEHYYVEGSTDGVLWNQLADLGGASRSAVISGLTNGVRYRFRVSAANRAGNGAWSSSVSSTPLSVPGAPGNLDGAPGDRSVALSWTAPLVTGGTRVTRYVVQRSGNGGLTWVTLLRGTSLSPTQSVRYLANARDYLFRVAAKNALGRGPWSVPFSVRPRTTPSAPLGLTAVAGSAEVALTWGAPPSDGGSSLSGYRVLWSTDGTNWTLAATTTDPGNRTYTVTGLTNGLAYRFRVSAVNAAGAGSPSDTRTATPQA